MKIKYDNVPIEKLQYLKGSDFNWDIEGIKRQLALYILKKDYSHFYKKSNDLKNFPFYVQQANAEKEIMDNISIKISFNKEFNFKMGVGTEKEMKDKRIRESINELKGTIKKLEKELKK